MKKILFSVLLIGIVFFYGGYSMISSSGKNKSVNSTRDLIRTNNISDDIYSDLLITDLSFDHDVSDTENDGKNISLMKTNLLQAPIALADSSELGKTVVEKEVEEKELGINSTELKITSSNIESSRNSDEKIPLVEKIKVHQVQRGENLWEIAGQYGVDIDTLIGANDIANMNTIQIGDSLRILPVKGILYKINPGENLWTISRKFNILSDKIVEANAIENPDLVQPGITLILPGAKPEFGYQDRLGKRFIYPVNTRISSYFGSRWGRQHEGIDFAVNTGTEVKAARAGKVVYSQWANGYGYTVVIEHQKGVRTLYAHNSRLLVHGGQWVEQGQAISLSGNTGNSTGPHLHFEVQINGQAVNPLNYIE